MAETEGRKKQRDWKKEKRWGSQLREGDKGKKEEEKNRRQARYERVRQGWADPSKSLCCTTTISLYLLRNCTLTTLISFVL